MQNQHLGLGIIYPEALYCLPAVKRGIGLREAALRNARKNGLIVHYKHGRGFVLGSDLIAYVVSPPRTES